MDDLPVFADQFENERHTACGIFYNAVVFLRLFPFAANVRSGFAEHFDAEARDVERYVGNFCV